MVEFSAVLSGVKDVREAVQTAKDLYEQVQKRTVLFVDEIHRFNKAQQDAFLPHVEAGTILLIGATTENPSFHLNKALLSRATLLVLEPLSVESLAEIAQRALVDEERGLGRFELGLSSAATGLLVRTSHGDARRLLNALEVVIQAAFAHDANPRVLDAEELERWLPKRPASHDRDGDSHYELISALHKSVRGGHPDAALYWLARMMEGGEDPSYLLRRLVRMAIEDIGLADPRALDVAVHAADAYERLGSPEGDLALAYAAVYLATSPKSNAVYAAFNEARTEVRTGTAHPVPRHLRNASTPMQKALGYGADYKYPHDFPSGVTEQDYLPHALRGTEWYTPTSFGHEKDIRKRMEWWNALLKEQIKERRDDKS
jgi:putative ATPase